MEDNLLSYLLLTITLSFVTTDGSLCYSCTNIPLPHVCDTIRQCGPHESCYVERFVSGNGATYYESGCKSNSTCGYNNRKKALFPECTECCNTDYCNKELCSHSNHFTFHCSYKNGGCKSQERSVNRCLKCSGVFNPADCLHVTTCSEDELCHTQETVQFGYTLFSLGCLPKSICEAEPVFGRRNIYNKRNEKCHQCCEGENCNRKLCASTVNTNKSSLKPFTKIPLQTVTTESTTKSPTTTKPASFRDCLSIYNQNIRTNGIYRISPDNQTYFDVYCDMDGGGWTLIQRRVNSSGNFSRGWNEYVNGFGDLSGNFWLGLEKIRLLTQPAVEILFEGYTIDTNEKGTMRYDNFYIDPLSNNYTMHVNATGVYNNVAHKNNYDNPIFNGFGYHNGQQFSTYDRPGPYKCAQTNGNNGGWWYIQCFIVFTTGKYDRMYFLNSTGKVKRVTVKIRRKQSH